MSDDKQTTEAREASQSRVTTQDTILANQATPADASTPPGDKPDQGGKDEDQPKPKHSPKERIREAIERRNKAEQEAHEAKREAAELRARLESLATQAPALEAEKPDRTKFANDEDYIEALADWKAKQAIIQREREQAEARAQAEMDEIVSAWSKRQEQAMKDIPDYEEVIRDANVKIEPHVHQAIIESEMGPYLAYYLALNRQEIKRLNTMKPISVVRYIVKLENELRETETDTTVKEDPKQPTKSKAPEPISPVKDASGSPGSAGSFSEYKRRRAAQKAK